MSETNSSPEITATPFVKWVGGKRQLIPVISEKLPAGLGQTITKYAEPFIGGGAVLFYMLQNFTLKEVYISDRNYALVETYKTIQQSPDELLKVLKKYKKEYMDLDTHERRTDYYNNKRAKFNTLIKTNLDGEVLTEQEKLTVCAIFIFLNKTCFNGLYRENSKGQFNSPHGKYSNPQIADEQNIQAIHKLLQNVKIVLADYSACESFVDANTFIYLDPPYRPLTKTANFTGYTKNGFNDPEQIQLADFLKEQSNKGAKIMLSNSDPHNTDPEDDFFDDLYSWGKLERVNATRAINTNGAGRGAISEILFTNY